MECEDGGIVGAAMKEKFGGDDGSTAWKLRVGSGMGPVSAGLRTGNERAVPIGERMQNEVGSEKGVVISMRNKTIVVEVDA
jgi:hypothetical protein